MVTKARLREKMKPFVRRFRGLAHIYRLGIVYLLAHESMTASALAECMGIQENLASHHLKSLYVSGWVLRVRSGREMTYRLNERAYGEFTRLFEDTPFEQSYRKNQK